MKYLIILTVLLLVGCGYAGTGLYHSGQGDKPGYPPYKGTVYYNESDDGSIRTFFHEGGVTNCVTTSSTVTCY